MNSFNKENFKRTVLSDLSSLQAEMQLTQELLRMVLRHLDIPMAEALMEAHRENADNLKQVLTEQARQACGLGDALPPGSTPDQLN